MKIKGILIIALCFVLIFLGGLILGALFLDASPENNTRISDNTTMSAYEALLFIDEAITSHQYYIDHPESQSFSTGNTVFNEKIIKRYSRLKELIERIDGGQ